MPSWKCPGSVFHGHSFIYVTTFCTVEKFWDSDDNSQELVALAVLLLGLRCGLGGSPHSHSLHAWWNLWSITPHPQHLLRDGQRLRSRRHVRHCRGFMEIYGKIFLRPRCTFIFIDLQMQSFVLHAGPRLPAGVAGAAKGTVQWLLPLRPHPQTNPPHPSPRQLSLLPEERETGSVPSFPILSP